MRPPKFDRSKLPVWAQREIERLERDIEHYKGVLSHGPEDSRVFADPFSSAPRPLGPNPLIEFRVGDDSISDRIRVRLEDRNDDTRIYVSGGTRMFIYPLAGNSVEIGITR